jgi:hypothetical protein
MRRHLLPALLVAILASPAVAQDEGPGYASELGVHLRFVYLGGDVADGEKWHNFFDDGVGVGLQYSALWRSSPTVELGVYLTFTYDQFNGGSGTVTAGAAALILEPDELTLQRQTIGFAAKFQLGNFQIEPRLGVGYALYNSVDADARIGTTQTKISAIDSSFEFAFEIGVRAGIPISEKLSITAGIAYENNGAPKSSSDLDTDLKAQENVVLDVGLTFSF